MNSFVFVALIAALAGAQAGYLHQPVVPAYYATPVQIATPVLRAEYPTYAVHSPAIGALPYSSGVAYAAAPIAKVYHQPAVYSAPLSFAYKSHGLFFRK